MYLTKIRFELEEPEYMPRNTILLKDILGRIVKKLDWHGPQEDREETVNSFVETAELRLSGNRHKHTLEFHQPVLKRTWKYPGMTEGEPYENTKYFDCRL